MNSELYWKFMMLTPEEREEILLVMEAFNWMTAKHPGWNPDRIEQVVTGKMTAESERLEDGGGYATLSSN